MPIFYEFKGAVNNEDIHTFYASNKVDCFVSASSSEGLPVSIMEAMSYGIPIVATDAGGTRELIDGNGILVDVGCTAKDICEAIYEVVNSADNNRSMGSKSRYLWEGKFDANKNARLFCEWINNEIDPHIENVVLVIDSLVSDWPFIESEVFELSKKHNVLIIDTSLSSGNIGLDFFNHQKKIKELTNVSIVFYHPNFNVFFNALFSIKYLFSRSGKIELCSIFHSRKLVIRRLYESIAYYCRASYFARWIKKNRVICESGANTLFYSFWHQYYTLGMILEKKLYSKICIITREHGYDLYDERREKSLRQPFRSYMDPELDSIIFACKMGKNYYCERHATVKSDKKYRIMYLGSKCPKDTLVSCDDKPRNPSAEKEYDIRIVSCSNPIPIKRVDMIIDALALLRSKVKDKRIKWVHFGSSDLLYDLEKQAKVLLTK